ncbi:RNAse M5 [Desulfitobacterium dichloroeliminans LMG P-21439]|uniref:Ribonuclease M5 n=1 Tax=Desulfitobacterium dichloroeliminans (strain LMG P-21439 / DCA1) TaxID=871963 RepID=L0F1A5_DESDL|nr:ribonuclease M5 [Desulfitobacterium dichloroeliminans]AGA67614.1 RNAse M5 [Desulfitobacterium dichloroeliminans LMG P-21439]
MIEELIVVEGKNDAHAVRRALGAVDILWTDGYGLTQEKLHFIAEAAQRRGVIVFTDPDSVGEQIRERISQRVPSAKHVYLAKKDARSKNDDDIGVENARPEDIRQAFNKIRSGSPESGQEKSGQKDIQMAQITFQANDLWEAGLVGSKDSNQRRLAVGKLLGIGDANGKQFLRRLNLFGITREEFAKAVKEARHGERS